MKKIFLAIFLVVLLTLPTAASLHGKVIIVNPGHGGGETGAIGLNGLEEHEINLKIGLYLRELLESAGATVYMSRDGGYDLNGTDHYSGTRDRFNRLRLGREKNADIFLALHHNASVNRDSNQIEVYYMPKYYGPSQDLAEYVVEGLKEEMELNGIATTMSQLIVNHATIPTIIGEASYISNPEMEKWFRNDANLKKIARGYFKGVKRFFQVGMPIIEPVTPGINEKVNQEQPRIFARISCDGESQIDPTAIRVFLDQQVIKHNYNPKSKLIEAKISQPLANGPHQLLIIGGNQAGIAAVPLDFIFYVDEKPESIILDTYPTYIPGQNSTVKICGQILDQDGQPVMDGNQIRFQVDGGYFDREWVFTENGRFINYLHSDNESSIAGIRIWAADRLEEIVVDYRSKDAYLTGQVIDTLTQNAFVNTKITLYNQQYQYSTQSDSEGYYYFSEVKPGIYNIDVTANGYETYSTKIQLASLEVAEQKINLTAIAGGVLNEQKIILNCAVESTEKQDIQLLKALQTKLEKAGAEVVINTDGDNDKSTVKSINKLFGNFLISIKWSNQSQGVIYHYPRSEKYQKIAGYLSIPGLNITSAESKSKLITFANTHSFIVEIPMKYSEERVVDGLYQFLIQYFQSNDK